MASKIILDAGHGGDMAAGKSSPNQSVGPRGTLEKNLALSIALRTRDALQRAGHVVTLTRDSDRNMSLRDRALLSRSVGSHAFVSLHFNQSATPTEQGCEVWVHDDASAPSSALGQSILSHVSAATRHPIRGLQHGLMAVLDPRFQAPGTAACLAEISFLSDPGEEQRLGTDRYRQRIAAAVADGIDAWTRQGLTLVSAKHEEFDIWHEVPLVPQLTGMSCWAAAAAMIVGWRDCIDIDPEEVAQGIGRWEAYRDGLEPMDVDALAATWGLIIEPARAYTVESLRALLERNGPLWAGEAAPGLHVIVIAGMYGDGTPDGTHVRVVDPWPIGQGERYRLTFRELAQNLDAVATVAGIRAQVLHSGGRNGSRRVSHWRSELSARITNGAHAPVRFGTPLGLFERYGDAPERPPLSEGQIAPAAVVPVAGLAVATFDFIAGLAAQGSRNSPSWKRNITHAIHHVYPEGTVPNPWSEQSVQILGVDAQHNSTLSNAWARFNVVWRYNGNDIDQCRVESYGSNDWTVSLLDVTFEGSHGESYEQNGVACIVMYINGIFNPAGEGDVEFQGSVLVKADGTLERLGMGITRGSGVRVLEGSMEWNEREIPFTGGTQGEWAHNMEGGYFLQKV